MAYVTRTGQVVSGTSRRGFSLQSIYAFLAAIFSFVVLFFKTLLNPSAADDYAARNRRSGGSSGGGGGGAPPRGPRITGMGDLRDASGAAACGGGG